MKTIFRNDSVLPINNVLVNLDGVEFEVTNNPAEETEIDIQLTPDGIERVKKNHAHLDDHLKSYILEMIQDCFQGKITIYERDTEGVEDPLYEPIMEDWYEKQEELNP